MQEIFSTIESPEVRIRLNLASDLRMFIELALAEATFPKLLSMTMREAEAGTVLARLVYLEAEAPDSAQMSDTDAALAVYALSLLGAGHAYLAHLAADVLLGSSRKLWWSKEAATKIQRTLRSRTASASFELWGSESIVERGSRTSQASSFFSTQPAELKVATLLSEAIGSTSGPTVTLPQKGLGSQSVTFSLYAA